MSSTAVEVGRRIRAARSSRGWSQAELAAKLPGQPTPTAISYWESGRRNIGLDELVELARVLGVAVSELLPDTQEQGPVTPRLRALQAKTRELAGELERLALEIQALIGGEMHG